MNPPFQVLYEDNHIIIVNKATGILSQGDITGDKTLIDYVKEYIKEKYDKPGEVFLGVPHRLDRPVSGLIVLARTSKALERMNKMFHDKEVQKVYWAVVRDKPQRNHGKLTNWLVKDEARNFVTAYNSPKDNSQRAELSYRTLGFLNDHYLLEVCPITGRPHQIRVQLAAVGCPIRGDVKYGYSRANADASINLHSRRIYFIHPVRKTPVVSVAGLPDSRFWEQFLVLDDFEVQDKNLDFLIT
jgi:23S rRNA pseudouridine1911/1915/1917 synthase